MEAKIDALLRINGGEAAEKVIRDLDRHFERTSGALPHGHNQDVVRDAGKDIQHVAAR